PCNQFSRLSFGSILSIIGRLLAFRRQGSEDMRGCHGRTTRHAAGQDVLENPAVPALRDGGRPAGGGVAADGGGPDAGAAGGAGGGQFYHARSDGAAGMV